LDVLVVQSHPSGTSFNEAILETVLSSLKRLRNIETTLIRLGKKNVDERIVERKPTVVIFIYPTWWGGYPASLMQWINEMHQSHSDLFQDVKTILSITTHGSSKFINLLQGEWGRWYTKNRLAKICDHNVKLEWTSLYKIDRCTHDQLENYLAKVKSDITEFIAG
jgi:putative NADPH-quinone reductase